MKLEQLRIEVVPSWMPNAGQYQGTIKYAGQSGEVTVNLSHELSMQILNVVAADMVETSKAIANDLTADIINSSSVLLENKA
jgi:hypothetical protein